MYRRSVQDFHLDSFAQKLDVYWMEFSNFSLGHDFTFLQRPRCACFTGRVSGVQWRYPFRITTPLTTTITTAIIVIITMECSRRRPSRSAPTAPATTPTAALRPLTTDTTITSASPEVPFPGPRSTGPRACPRRPRRPGRSSTWACPRPSTAATTAPNARGSQSTAKNNSPDFSSRFLTITHQYDGGGRKGKRREEENVPCSSSEIPFLSTPIFTFLHRGIFVVKLGGKTFLPRKKFFLPRGKKLLSRGKFFFCPGGNEDGIFDINLLRRVCFWFFRFDLD